jgi:hypothetical protein
VALDDGVPVTLDVALRVAVALDDGVPVTLDVALRVAVALKGGVPVALDVEGSSLAVKCHLVGLAVAVNVVAHVGKVVMR